MTTLSRFGMSGHLFGVESGQDRPVYWFQIEYSCWYSIFIKSWVCRWVYRLTSLYVWRPHFNTRMVIDVSSFISSSIQRPRISCIFSCNRGYLVFLDALSLALLIIATSWYRILYIVIWRSRLQWTIIVFSALRTYALTERNLGITVIVIILSLIPFIANLVCSLGI